MIVRFQYTPADLQQAAHAEPGRRAWNDDFLAGGLILITMAFGGGAIYAGPIDHRWLDSAILLVIAAGAARSAWKYLGGEQRKALRQDPTLSAPHELDVSERCLILRGPVVQNEFPWESWQTAWEAGDVFVLRAHNPRYGLLVPKRAFTPEQLVEFRELLARKIPQKK